MLHKPQWIILLDDTHVSKYFHQHEGMGGRLDDPL
jgi:hypothetical protein